MRQMEVGDVGKLALAVPGGEVLTAVILKPSRNSACLWICLNLTASSNHCFRMGFFFFLIC